MKPRISLEALKLRAGLLYCRQGPWPFAALVLFLACLFVAVLVIPGQISATSRANAELQRLTKEQAALRSKPERDRISPAQGVARVLSEQRSTNAQIRKLLEDATGMGLLLTQSDYRRITETQQPLSEFQIALPLKGEYPQLRLFLFTALAEIPSLSIEQLTIRRAQGINSTQIDAQVVLSVWQKPGESAAVASAGGVR